jgi:hypothetical protein
MVQQVDLHIYVCLFMCLQVSGVGPGCLYVAAHDNPVHDGEINHHDGHVTGLPCMLTMQTLLVVQLRLPLAQLTGYIPLLV